MRVEGKIVDIYNREIFQGSVEVYEGHIVAIERHAIDVDRYIMPGFIDAHLHIESSMLTPETLSDAVIGCGSVAVVTDPHEIANVMGVEGVEYMVRSAERAHLKCFFTIPSSVPATSFDLAGGVITASDVEAFAKSGRFVALSEVMNVPGVIYEDKEVMAKLDIAKRYGLPIDGHAPLLSGGELKKYIESGITTDHECCNISEAREKISCGMKIFIREGSAAKNYEALKGLIESSADMLMFCTDDSHADDIVALGHIDKIVRRAIADGYSLFDVLRIASINPIEHYNLNVGSLRVGDSADFIVVSDLTNFTLCQSYIGGVKCFDVEDGTNIEPSAARECEVINNFNHDKIDECELKKQVDSQITIIGVIKDELVTEAKYYTPNSPIENLESDIEKDVLKIVYINRYTNGKPQVAYCTGFGLKRGAIASSIGHDSHNIVAVGTTDAELTLAINSLIESRGGLVVCESDSCSALPLPIGGIISDMTCEEVAISLESLHAKLVEMGSMLDAPFMTLSFLSLVVIPEVKIGEKGLFSYSKFNWLSEC
ncbi:MAG: adenine deaminase [Rikenellaceae bacterium]